MTVSRLESLVVAARGTFERVDGPADLRRVEIVRRKGDAATG